MRLAVFTLFMLCVSLHGVAQQQNYTAFTVNDGLPSNYIQPCVEDDKGFLWVCTDSGIARFDGKHFQLFTTKEGLPDNEVLAVIKETNGRIWVSCFKQGPAYFDEIKNRFISGVTDTNLRKVKLGTAMMYLFSLQGGGVMYYNETGYYFLKDKKVVRYNPYADGVVVKQFKNGTKIVWNNSRIRQKPPTLKTTFYHVAGGTRTDSISLGFHHANDVVLPAFNNDRFYNLRLYSRRCYIYTDFETTPFKFKTDSVVLPEACIYYSFTPTFLSFYGSSGKIYVYDKKTLKLLLTTGGNYAPNSLLNDSKGNIWISTIDKGLLMYRKTTIQHLTLPPGFQNSNFFSIAQGPGGSVLAGNFNGEVLENNGGKAITHALSKTPIQLYRVRKIIVSQNKVFTFSENGTSVNFENGILTVIGSLFYAKTAVKYNDSIILVGQVGAFYKLNTVTEKATRLNFLPKRVTALAKTSDGMVYYGSTDGLYKYSYAQNKGWALTKDNQLFAERVTDLCATADGLLWVATSGKGVFAVKNDKVQYHFTTANGIINNAVRNIVAAAPGQLWIGTGDGISILNYAVKDKAVRKIQNLSVNDGLTNNVINEMVYQNDTVYAATADGISVIPAKISIPKFNIPVYLTGISINQRDTILSASYKLKSSQRNIQMHFAGVELGGHFKNLQYTLDRLRNWIALDQNTLTIQLSSGSHTVQVRAVDVNGNISNKILTLKFDVETPFWKSVWFWITLAAITQIAIIYVVNRRLKKRKEARLAKEILNVQTASLEQQAFTSLMNPHFMFNALNSVQHYINLQDRQNANRYLSDFASLIRKNFEAAQQSFIPLEQEMENIKIYLRLEQMRFNDRFAYEVAIADNLDTEDWMVPTMIVQPLLENALLHGLMPSSIDGKLTIGLTEQNGDLLITITDNGIGMANSVALKALGNHKSRGMELIRKRVGALSRFGAHAITISMAPAFASEKNPGNQVTLFIPRNLHAAWQQAQRPA
jgi:ligand-binding sensor domain-containing protein/signal transduction histidine kinase